MSDPTSTARPSPATPPPPAPEPIGDVVPGDPPVPITVWHLPKPRAGTVLPRGVLRRLIANYTPPGAVVTNLASGQHLPPAGHRPAALIITEWPLPKISIQTHLRACVAGLDDKGCLAVIVTTSQIPDQLGLLVGAARTAGLRYLQHIVIAHHLTPRHRAENGSRRSERHLRVNTDVLVFLSAGRTHD